MPRRRSPGAASHEATVARRVAHERERRGMTYEAVAAAMTAAGSPMNSSAVYKIEKGEPRRRITVDEYYSFAAIFDLSPADLLVPPEVADEAEIADLVRQFAAAAQAARGPLRELEQTYNRLRTLAGTGPGLRRAVRSAMELHTPAGLELRNDGPRLVLRPSEV